MIQSHLEKESAQAHHHQDQIQCKRNEDSLKNKVHFHTLQSTACRTHHVWHPSREYVDLYPTAARHNHMLHIGFGPTYKIESIKEEDKRQYWEWVPRRSRAVGNAEESNDEDHPNTIVATRKGCPPTFSVNPEELDGEGFDTVLYSKKKNLATSRTVLQHKDGKPAQTKISCPGYG